MGDSGAPSVSTAVPGTSRPPQRIVILGSGFGGVYTARYLQHWARRRAGLEVVLVNRENYFVYQPLLAEVVSGNIGIMDTVNPVRRLLPHVRLIVREVEQVDLAARTVTLGPGFEPRPYVLPFDHLVLALGNVTDFRRIPGLYEHAMPFKTLADAISLRNHLLRALEEASIQEDPEQRRTSLTFVVAGGGFSGVEVAAEMNDFLRHAVRAYAPLRAEDVRVVLVHSGQRVLERELNASLSAYATETLRKQGVELKLGARLKTATPQAAILADGERINCRTLVSTVPSSPNPILEALPCAQQGGKVAVDRFLQVPEYPHVWALGDGALVPSPAGGSSPPTAQHAIRQAQVVARNIAAQLEGRPLTPFDFRGLGKMGSLGHHCAVVELFDRIRLRGFLAWLMWRTVYWWKLPGAMRKARVGVSWFFDLLFPPDLTQLRVGISNALTHAHFEPGDIVFRQGDLGDALYIILRGEAEVLIETDGAQRLVSELRTGDFFGELALMNARTRTATIRCRTAMDVLALRKAEFSTLAANLPELRSSFERVAQERLARR